MVTGRERSRFTTISSHSSLMDLKAQRGKHLSNTKQQRPRCNPSSSLEESTCSEILNTKPKQLTVLDKSHRQKAAFSQKGMTFYSSSSRRRCSAEAACHSCPRSPLSKMQCHLLDTHVPGKACFGQVHNGRPRGFHSQINKKYLNNSNPY